MESSLNNNNIRHLDTRGVRPERLEQYFRQQPPNSVAIFFRSSAADYDDLSQKFRDMLIRANQIVHLRTLLLNIGEIHPL